MDHVETPETVEEFEDVESLREKIVKIIEQMPPDQVTLAEIMDIIGADSLLLLTIFLSLVFLVPVSIPGVSTVFGTAILLIGITRLLNRKLWLPRKIADRKLSSEKLKPALDKALTWFTRLEKISKPHRQAWITSGGVVGIINSLSVILGAILLMFPFGFVPFSNTLPAIALIFLAVGLMQKDGISIILGHVSNVATMIYFAFLLFGGGMGIYQIIELIKTAG
ncbi:MAG: exopolysaccharide biosynthesis protein [Anaerolineaceae bacterium]|nr:exopolysaccharide biosynthesis protein [Anaerolineaceae bacterium]